MRISDWSSDVCSSDLKLRAAPLSREFLRRLGVEEGAPAILDPIVSNSQEAADRELEPFRSRIINDACIHVRPPANPRASGIQLKRRMISTKRSQDLASSFVGDVATPNKSPDRLVSAKAYQGESGAGNMPKAKIGKGPCRGKGG